MNNLFEFVDNFALTKNVKSLPIVISNKVGCKYTIAIPTYRRSRDLFKAITSAINQNYLGDYNILVVDNNPERNDETEQMVKTEFANCQSLSYYKNEQNLGMAGNWNRLFMLSSTCYVVMLHDDDYLLPNYLTTIDKLIVSERDVAVANTKKIMWNGELPIPLKKESGRIRIIRYSLISNYPYFHFGPPSGCLFNKQIVIEEGGFNNDWYPSSDYAFIVKLCYHNRNVIKIQNKLLLYKTVENTTSKPETQQRWIETDRNIKDQMYSVLNLPRVVKIFVNHFEIGIRRIRIQQITSGNKQLSFANTLFKMSFRIYRLAYKAYLETFYSSNLK